MDKQEAQNIVRNTFESSFDKGRFTKFIKDLLNFIEDASFSYKGNFIPDAYEQYISSLERIGKYTAGDYKIDILVVKLKKKTSIERARTMQRNFIAWYLNGSRGGEMKDAALAAFVAPNGEDWRFSLVKMDYRFEEGKNGKVKVKEEFTPARRWSFLVGKNENSHTAQSKLYPIIADDERNPTLAGLEEAFNIEKVTKEFFEKYRDLFLRTKETLDDVVSGNTNIKADFEAKGVNTVDFAKKLLGQIVFLYFLQKKGWFGVKRDAEWGTGTKHFLRELFEGKHGTYTNFFNDILESLFYEALRIDRGHDDGYYSRFNCKIPFLNGGLFDPINNYDWVHTDIILPNELFSNSFKTKEGDTGNGILDIFDRYNFTVKEDEPLEKEVAVDPEMLGKVFENLLEVKDRKSKGTYYTPREIVHYMCRQSLINYLATECNIPSPLMGEGKGEGEGVIISKEDLETLIKYGEQVGENEATVIAKGRETDTYYHKLPESIRQNAALIDEKLANIKVCDPAIGSGAFPVGMMSEIVKTRNVLSVFLSPSTQGNGDAPHTVTPPPSAPPLKIRGGRGSYDPGGGKGGFSHERTPYNFKRECIEKSLYGVDIDPGAVEIAKLRLWLSLMVDEEDIKQIKPLPNLDYKIVCGNSLLGVNMMFHHQALIKLEDLKGKLFEETNPTKKGSLKVEIDNLISEVTHNDRHFDFKVYFSEVFHQNDGFDITIGNPPYVRADSGEKHLAIRKEIIAGKQFETLWEKWDLYVPFIERAYKLLKSGGVSTMIVSDAYCHSKYAQKSQNWFLQNSRILRLDFLSKIKVFEAGVHNIVYFFQKAKGSSNNPERREHEDEFGKIKVLPTDEQKNLTYRAFFPQEQRENISGIPLEEICYITYGLRPSSDEHEAKGEFVTADLVTEKRDNIHCKPYVEGKHLNNWYCSTHLWIEWGTDRAPARFCRPTFPELYLIKEKLLAQRSPGPDPVACYDNEALVFTPASVGFILWHNLSGVRNNSLKKAARYKGEKPPRPDLPKREELEKTSRRFDVKYLLAVMNSTVARDFLRANRRSNIHLYPDDWKKLPIPDVTPEKQRSIVDLVAQILTAKKKDPNADTSALEKQIDEMVYALYSLTPEDIAIVEGKGLQVSKRGS